MDIPYFGPALQTMVRCATCAFRHADTLLTREEEPARYTLHVTGTDGLRAKVVRSQSGTVRLPEIGGVLEPGPRSESFLTTGEGLLWRFRDAVRSAMAVEAEGDGAAVIARLDAMIAGREPFTIIVEDPTGNSRILHPQTTRETLSKEYAEGLKRGSFVLDVSELTDLSDED